MAKKQAAAKSKVSAQPAINTSGESVVGSSPLTSAIMDQAGTLSSRELIELLLSQCPDLLTRASKATRSVLSGISGNCIIAQIAPDRDGESMFAAALLRYPIMHAMTFMQDDIAKALGHQGTITEWKTATAGCMDTEKTAHMAAARLLWDISQSAAESLHDDLGRLELDGEILNTKPYRGLVFWSEHTGDWEHLAYDLWRVLPQDLRNCYAGELSLVNTREVRRLSQIVEQEWDRYLLTVADVTPPADGKDTNLWTPEEEAKARYFINNGTVTKANQIPSLLGINRKTGLALYRHITGKPKKSHQSN